VNEAAQPAARAGTHGNGPAKLATAAAKFRDASTSEESPPRSEENAPTTLVIGAATLAAWEAKPVTVPGKPVGVKTCPHGKPRRSFSRWICVWIISSVIPPDENVANACMASPAPQAASGQTNQVTVGE
jgi:hypothetical protein